MKKGLSVLVVLAMCLTLFGCQSDYTVLVKNAKKANIVTLMNDYVGLSGYKITFVDSTKSNFKILAGVNVYSYNYQNINYSVGSIEESFLNVQIKQVGKDVSLKTKGEGYSEKNWELAEGFIEHLKKTYTLEIAEGVNNDQLK